MREVAANGDAILMYRFDANDSIQAHRWTIGDGPVPLDFVPSDMSADGRVVVGMRGDQAVIWDRAGGTRRLDGEALDAPLVAEPDGQFPAAHCRWSRSRIPASLRGWPGPTVPGPAGARRRD